MSASLVGSEMCIRDRCPLRVLVSGAQGLGRPRAKTVGDQRWAWSSTVSYTHLTLPTICSV
eukprot:6549090-Alexandrium_andersonii.AAC.1